MAKKKTVVAYRIATYREIEKAKNKRANGGKATFKKYGSEHFRALAKKMHRKRRANLKKNGPEQ